MTGYNTATKIGNAVCLPGDVVFGAGGGVLFIPSHLVEEVVGGAAKTQVRDLFGFEMITLNKFTTAQIDKKHFGLKICLICLWNLLRKMTERSTAEWTGPMNTTCNKRRPDRYAKRSVKRRYCLEIRD